MPSPCATIRSYQSRFDENGGVKHTLPRPSPARGVLGSLLKFFSCTPEAGWARRVQPHAPMPVTREAVVGLHVNLLRWHRGRWATRAAGVQVELHADGLEQPRRRVPLIVLVADAVGFKPLGLAGGGGHGM